MLCHFSYLKKLKSLWKIFNEPAVALCLYFNKYKLYLISFISNMVRPTNKNTNYFQKLNFSAIKSNFILLCRLLDIQSSPMFL